MLEASKGDEGLTADLVALGNKLAQAKTAKELHNVILAAKKDLPSVKQLNSPTKAIAENSVVGRALGLLKKVRDDAEPAYKAADEAYKQHKAKRTQKLQDTDLGSLATRSGSVLEQDAQRTKVFALLSEGESPNVAPKDSRLAKDIAELRKKDPKGTYNLIKTYLDKVITETFGKSKEAFTSERPGEALTARLGDASNPANDARLHGLRSALAEVSKGRMTASQRLVLQKGVDRLVQLANANSRTPKNPRAYTRAELEEVSRDPKMLDALRLIGVNPGSVFVTSFRKRLGGKTYAELDELFSNPDKVEVLIKLGQQKAFTQGQLDAIAAIVGLSQTSTGQPEENDARK
jgi:hypothetical protein